MTARIYVTPQAVAAAKLKIDRARARGLPVSAATQAVADARPATDEEREAHHAGSDGSTG